MKKLDVDTGKLISHGNYLISCSSILDSALDSLDTEMKKISDGWNDSDGKDFQLNFSNFIKEAKKIDTEIELLGKYALKTAGKYEQLLNKSIEMMGE